MIVKKYRNMKGFKYILGISIAVTALFTSCDTDSLGSVYESQTMGVTFATGTQRVSFPAHDYEGFDVEVIRGVTDEAATYNIVSAHLLDASGNATDLPSTIQVPATVSFAAGEGISSFHVTVGDIVSGINYKLAITLDESVAPVDAHSTKVITIYRDYTYSAVGTGLLRSEFFGDETGPATGEVEWEKADQITWYRALSPYDDGYDIVFKVASDGKTVTVDEQPIASDISGYGTAYVAGSGTLIDGVITVTLEFTVSAGSFGTAKEIFVLPAEVK